jgi:two-component system, OmpR family, KDP operon response regulator KdpE
VTRLLLVDDEANFLRALGTSLRARGYQVDLAATGEEGLDLAAANPPDVVLLDLGLPGMDGLQVLQKLRERSRVPVIVLSARHNESSKVAALDLGADDYVTKPFGMDELLARLRAALRRGTVADETAGVSTADFSVDLVAKQVRSANGEIRLTPTQWHLVEILVRNSGRLVSQRELLEQVWGPTFGEQTHYLRIFMAQIRRKLEPEPSRPRYFITEPGMGYRFEPGPGATDLA